MFVRLAAILMASSAASTAFAATQAQLDQLAGRMGVKLQILDNKPTSCPKQASGCFLSQLDLTMPHDLAPGLSGGDLKVFFSSVSPVIDVESDTFTVRLINGDLHVLELRPGAKLEAGKSYPVRIWSQGHFFSAFYPMPNMFLVSGKLAPRTIAATKPVLDPQSSLETQPYVAPMNDEARLATASPEDETRWQTPERAFEVYAERDIGASRATVAILPTPASVRMLQGPRIDLTHGVRIRLQGLQRADLDSAIADLGRSGVRDGTSGPELHITAASASIAPEGYRLTAARGRIDIEAADATGARYALQSLAQQAVHDRNLLSPIAIEDAPRFPFRGLHVDLARNFHSKGEVLRLVDQMGRYKLNKLHLHLGDDEGWRLEIERLPELTDVGGYRCYDPAESRCLLPQLGAGPDRNTPVNGFLSRSDYLEILAAAKMRGIEVIPSFDMPGHSRAAIRSMEARYRRLMAAGRKQEAQEFRLAEPDDKTEYRSVQNYSDNTLNVCLESTYRFIDVVIDELKTLHSQAGVPLRTYHIGADETAGAWSKSPACVALMAKTGRTVQQLGPMFIERVSTDLAAKGIEVAGWSDGLGHVDAAKMPAKVQSNIWGDLFTTEPAEAHRHANRGWRTVIGVPNILYFDVPYAPHPSERGYDWPTRGTDTFKVFSFLPDNLAANASIMKDIRNRGTRMTDPEPLAAGRKFAGMQAQLWSETVRSDELANYMLFPRLLAFAERAWHRADWEPSYRPGTSYSYGDGQVDGRKLTADWKSFASKLPAQLRALDKAGVFYRVAPPGARIVGGKLQANTEFPDQVIEYRTEGQAWRRYRAPVRISGPIELRARSYDGRRTSRVVEVSTR